MAEAYFQTAGAIAAGNGCFAAAGERIAQLGNLRTVLIVTSPSMERQGFVAELRGNLGKAGMASRVVSGVMPEPTVQHIEELCAQAAGEGESFDACVGLGGGSVLDAAKLLAVLLGSRQRVTDMLGVEKIAEDGLPTILIPTTSGTGSEVTPNAIVTVPEERLKIGIVSRRLYAKLVIADPELTLSLPRPITASTGMDALTHALESFIGNKANPISDMFALESIRRLSRGMVEAYEDGSSLPARESMLLGSVYGGMALACSGTAAVHALAYPLGGRFNIAHGTANAMLLPHVMAFQLDAIAQRLVPVAEAMGLGGGAGDSGRAEQVLRTISEWTERLRIPQNLRPFGVAESDIGELAVMASKVTRLLGNNPKPLTTNDMEAIYRKLL